MEKFTKFDDQASGQNPFMPYKAQDLNFCLRGLRYLLQGVLVHVRVPCLIIIFFVYNILNFLKMFLIVPAAIRFAEVNIDWLFMRFYMNTCSFNSTTHKYHKDDEKFDYMKAQKNENPVEMVPGDVLVCNQTCFIDWIFLLHQWSPIMTRIVTVDAKHTHLSDEGSKKVGLRIISGWEWFCSSLGLVFPDEWD